MDKTPQPKREAYKRIIGASMGAERTGQQAGQKPTRWLELEAGPL
ncbi:MAG: hypothetical protein V1716_05305 [Candidatus Uhrbacteria bacterium]